MNNPGTINVLLVDDHPVVRDGYRRLLETTSEIRVQAEAGTGEEAYRLYFETKPDVLILDLSLPGSSGLETLRRIRCKDPDARVLVFSMHDSPLMVTRAMEAGAAGYLTKASAASQMVEAVREVAQGRSFLTPDLLPGLMAAKDRQPDPLRALTPREFQVFVRLAQGQAVSEIARTLNISRKTVGVHQTNIMHKLALRNTSELTRLAIRCGAIQA